MSSEGATAELQVCNLCHVPTATGDCTHIIRANGQVTMTEKEWTRLVDELWDLRAKATDDD